MENSTRIKGPDYAREAIRLLAAGNPNHSTRVKVTAAAIRLGNYTDEAKAVMADYLAAGCPRQGD